MRLNGVGCHWCHWLSRGSRWLSQCPRAAAVAGSYTNSPQPVAPFRTLHFLLASAVLSWIAPAWAEETRSDELVRLEAAARVQRAAARKETRAAKAARGRGEEGRAGEHQKAAQKLADSARELKEKATALIEKTIQGLLADLDADEFSVREQASKRLLALPARAVPLLKRSAEGKSPEVQERLNAAARSLGQGENGSGGWAGTK